MSYWMELYFKIKVYGAAVSIGITTVCIVMAIAFQIVEKRHKRK